MRTVKTLIDECRELCSSDAALARRLDVSGNHPHEWRTGKRPISPATVGQLCDVLGLDGEEARRLAAEAVIASAKPEKQGVLRRAFFVSESGAMCGARLLDANDESVTAALLVVIAAIDAAKSTSRASGQQMELCHLWSNSKTAPLCET